MQEARSLSLDTPAGIEPIAAQSGSLEEDGEPLADADAERREPTAPARALETPEQREGEADPGRAQRVPERDRPALGVDELRVEPEPPYGGDHLRRERLVDL